MFLVGFLVAVGVYFLIGIATSIWMIRKFAYMFLPVMEKKAKIWNMLWHCSLTWPHYILEFKD